MSRDGVLGFFRGGCECLELVFGGTRCLAWHFRRLSDRAPPARRIATQGRSYICFGPIIPGALARGPLVPPSISRRTNKAVARKCHWPHWPETNVGASLARDAPRGRRSISAPPPNPRQAPSPHHPISRQAHSSPTPQHSVKIHKKSRPSLHRPCGTGFGHVIFIGTSETPH